ncbi:hypothetical protein KVT40_005726 [Elsinoe batatas]|uniref:Uncharacterized protein n=1 Tax=Elsinoe batatas TaxID=2601811 RepID=A0A8K0L332_9PEZI|nr:hypothetical protein KVT40_005726 [Elsinoe batatas]
MPPYGDFEARMEEWHRGRLRLQWIIAWLHEVVIYLTGQYYKGAQDLDRLQHEYVHLHNTAWLEVHWAVLNEYYWFLDHSRHCLDLYHRCALALAHVLYNARMLLEAVDRDFQDVFGICINEMARGRADWVHSRAVWTNCGFESRLSILSGLRLFVVCQHAATRYVTGVHFPGILTSSTYDMISSSVIHISSTFFTSLFNIHQLCITWPSLGISNDQAQKANNMGSAQSSGPNIDNDTAVVATNDTFSPSDHDLTQDSNKEETEDAPLPTAPVEPAQHEVKGLSRAASIACIHLIGLTSVNVLLLLPLAPNVTRIATTMDNTQMLLDEALLTAETDEIERVEEVTEAFDEVHAYTQMMERVMVLSREVKDLAFAAMDALAEGDEEQGMKVYKEAVKKQKEMTREIEGMLVQQSQDERRKTELATTISEHEDDASDDEDRIDADCPDDELDEIDFDEIYRNNAAKLVKVKAGLAAPFGPEIQSLSDELDLVAQMDIDEELMWGLENTSAEALERRDRFITVNREVLEHADKLIKQCEKMVDVVEAIMAACKEKDKEGLTSLSEEFLKEADILIDLGKESLAARKELRSFLG